MPLLRALCASRYGPRDMARLRRSLSMVAATLVLAAPAQALEVRQVLWGFDGRAVPGRFNPVSLLIANPGGQNFDGEVVLEESRGINVRDAEIAQAVYLAARQERWVQFQIFVQEGMEYRASWGRGAKENVEIPQPQSAAPARVLLTDPANPFAAAGGLRAFPDDLFPTSVAATDGLDAVALDYEPRWEAARREAFLDWLRRGGIVMVLQGANGAHPRFSEALAALNIEGDSARVGAGTVLRAKAARRDASDKLFLERDFPALELKTNAQAPIYDLEATLFQRLASLTRPEVSWALLNTFTVAYLLLVGPLHYRWGRRLDYRLAIAMFAGTVAVFGWLFALVGRRGYGESQTVHSLTIARALGGGRCDAMQWVSAFATRGAIYSLTHDAPANYYSAVPQNDSVRGRISNGRDGKFLADIPLYSTRPFVHRGVMQGDDTSVAVVKWEAAASKLSALELKPGPSFPKHVLEMAARYDERLYEMKKKDGHWVATIVGSERIDERFSDANVRPLTYRNFSPNETRDAVGELRALRPLLEARAIGGGAAFRQSIGERPQPEDQVQLWIFAAAPEGFHMRGKGFTKENGCVLYVQDVFRR